MPVIETIKDKCKRCYSCVHNCPAKAISIEHGQAMVIQERCIGCGRCVRVCAQNAKKIESGIEDTQYYIKNEKETFALLAPSFPAAFPEAKPNQVVGALKQLGFSQVIHVALGADLIAKEYARIAKIKSMTTVITTPCPAVVNYIEKYHPSLLLFLAPIVSPMIAAGRVIRYRINPDAKIVFIGPCIAKKKEKVDPMVAGIINQVLTFRELKSIFFQNNILVEQCNEETFDPPLPYMGGIFPISGGLLRAAQLKGDILENDIIITEGTDRVLDILRRVEEGKVEASFLDLLFCEGCINGPAMGNDLSVFIRKDIVANYVRQWLDSEISKSARKSLLEFNTINLNRKFTKEAVPQPAPSEKDIKKILAQMNKFKADDELNCGACGYATCREKAIAVYQGLAEAEMCLPYLIERLETMNKDMQETHEQLLKSERLASMGELAAGVAHEINNPLAGVLTYIKLMQKRIKMNNFSNEILEKFCTYLDTMESETTRVSEIVKSLLEFARPSEPVMAKVSIIDIIKKTLFLIGHQISLQNIDIEETYADTNPYVTADFKQIQQVLLNLLINAAQAMPQGGNILVQVNDSREDQFIDIHISDSGCGIPAENVEKIFDPFFTTKSNFKGTGLGLSTAYSIVIKHGGLITVKSEINKGTEFTIRLPRYNKEC